MSDDDKRLTNHEITICLDWGGRNPAPWEGLPIEMKFGRSWFGLPNSFETIEPKLGYWMIPCCRYPVRSR